MKISGRKSIPKKGNQKILYGVLLILLVVILGGGFYWSNRPAPEPVNPIVIPDPTMTKEQIQEVIQLANIQESESVVLHESKIYSSWYYEHESKYSVLLTGTVSGRIDVRKVNISINNEQKTVSVIFNDDAIVVSPTTFNEKDLKFVTTQTQSAARVTVYDHMNSRRKAERRIQEKIQDKGIKNKTKEVASNLLTEFIEGLGYTLEIEFS